jgi:hypothetical protein
MKLKEAKDKKAKAVSQNKTVRAKRPQSAAAPPKSPSRSRSAKHQRGESSGRNRQGSWSPNKGYGSKECIMWIGKLTKDRTSISRDKLRTLAQ